MRIKSIRIDGFGVWRDLELGELSGQATVFYGPNEAGKTTLMQFVRSVLYGYSPARKQRYLPPLGGGRPGGVLSVDTAEGRCEVARWQDRGGTAVVTSPDGTQQGEAALSAMLGGVDEAIFNNVYACGLREIQELGTLTDTEAARHLYDLTTGLDRVSLVDVQRELTASRQRLLADEGRPSVISRLLTEQARLVSELDTARAGLARYLRLSAERTTLESDVAAAEIQSRAADAEMRLLDAVVAIRPKWLERIDVAAQLEAMPPTAAMPAGAVERLQRLHRKIKTHKKRIAGEETHRKQLQEEAAKLTVNEPLWRQGPRIEALVEQRDWIAALVNQAAAAEASAAQLETQVAAARSRLGLPVNTLLNGGLAAPARLQARPRDKALRRVARVLSAAKRRRREASQAIEAAAAGAGSSERELSARLKSTGETDLQSAIEKHGALAGQLRRRMQLDERLAQMNRNQEELTEQSHQSLDRQLLPTNVLIGLGSAFVVGTLLVLVGLLMPASIVGTLGWPLALLGLCGAVAGAGGKFLMQRSAAKELESCRKQLSLLEQQIKDAQQERDDLDRRLPRGGGPLASRLKATEASLAELEELLPLDARRQLAQREVQSARARSDEHIEQYRAARRGWRKALRSAGLPETLTPQQARQMAAAGSELSQHEVRLQEQREQAAQSRRELAGCTQRASQLAADAGLDIQGLDVPAVVDRLAAALSEQRGLVHRRGELSDALRAARLATRRRKRRIVALRRRRRRWLSAAGANNSAAFRRLALAHARREVLVRQHATLSAEVAATAASLSLTDAGKNDWETHLTQRLNDPVVENLERNRQHAAVRASTAASRLQQLHSDRGRLDEQIAALAADRGSAELTLELSTVQQQLREAVTQWQERAVCGLILDEIRTQYERERQPATLKDASEHLNRLTSGTYPRVWTPLGERKLLVDDSQGRPLSPEVLSEGTREQLFLSLRLALIARYAERGVRLPLVLDDVLVNFDAERAKAAVHVLRDFAKSGHQVLLFTCHDHIVKAFKAAKVETRPLPLRTAGTEVFRNSPEPEPEVAVELQQPAPPVVAPPVIEQTPPAPIVFAPVMMPPLVAPPTAESKPEKAEKPAKTRRKPKVDKDKEESGDETRTRIRWRRKPIDEFTRIEFGHVSPPLEDEEMERIVEHVPKEKASKPQPAIRPEIAHEEAEDESSDDDEQLYGIVPAADLEPADPFELENEQLSRLADEAEDTDHKLPEDDEFAELDEEEMEEAEYDDDEEIDYDAYDDESEAA